MTNAYFTKPPDLAPVTKARSVDINTLSAATDAAFDAISPVVTGKASATGQVWSGIHDFTGATSILVPTRAIGTTGNYAVNADMLNAAIFATVLPGQALGFMKSTGTVASFGTTHTGYAQKEVKGADIVCAATIDLSTATGNLVHITGNTGPVTAITIASGAEYTVVCDSTPTFTYNATSMILPGAANLTVNAGAVLKIRGDGTNNARITISDPATSAEVKAAVSGAKPITPASALAAQGFTSYAQTADQAITSAGALTIAHGLGRVPVLVLGFLKNITAESNYVTGDVVPVPLGGTQAVSNAGVSYTADATNIYVRYGSTTTATIAIIDKTSGVQVSATNSKWSFFMRAWG